MVLGVAPVRCVVVPVGLKETEFVVAQKFATNQGHQGHGCHPEHVSVRGSKKLAELTAGGVAVVSVEKSRGDLHESGVADVSVRVALGEEVDNRFSAFFQIAHRIRRMLAP